MSSPPSFGYQLRYTSPSQVTLPPLSSLLRGSPDSTFELPGLGMADDFIDLTAEPTPPPHSLTTSRAANTYYSSTRNGFPGAVRKRRRLFRERSSEIVTPSSSAPREPRVPAYMTISDNIEEVDLTAIEDGGELMKAQSEQKKQQEVQIARDRLQKDSVASQGLEHQGPPTLSNLNCTICLCTVTNLTATHCGHLFCHECLMGALVAGERQGPDSTKSTSKCPICRKPVARLQKSKRNPEFIPLEIKLKKKSDIAKGKEKATSAAP